MKKAVLSLLALACLFSMIPSSAAVTDRYVREIKFYKDCGLEITDDKYIYGLPCKKTVSDVTDLLATKDEISIHDFGSKTPLESNKYVGTNCKIARPHAGYSKESYTFIVSGDLNGDGNITSTDYLKIKKSFAGTVLTPIEMLAADVDRNSKVVSADYLLVKKYFSGNNLFEKALPEIPQDNSTYTVRTYESYDLDTYMLPLWNSRVTYNESCFMLGPDASATLMYTPETVLGVYSNDFKKQYVEGVDYKIEGNKIIRLENSTIPYLKESRYYNLTSNVNTYNDAGEEVPTYYGESTAMTQYQVFVTYSHKDYWTGFNVQNQSSRFESLIKKLENGEDVTFAFYGDSITFGQNCSSHLGISPFTPSWAIMLTNNIAKKYGYKIEYISTGAKNTAKVPAEGASYGNNGTITYINTAVGGWRSDSGISNFETHLKPFITKYGCDLFICAFGMNDPDMLPVYESLNNEILINKVHEIVSDASVLLVSPMPFNVDCSNSNMNGNQRYFEPAYIELADKFYSKGKDVAVAPVYSLVKSVLDYKLYRDITGNNLNHTNDFLTRLYAQTCYQTVVGY